MNYMMTRESLLSLGWYRKSIFSNMFMQLPAYALFDHCGMIWIGAFQLLFIFMLFESFYKTFNETELINRYIIHSLLGIISVIISVIELPVPIITYFATFISMIYFAFNHIIKSKLILLFNISMIITAIYYAMINQQNIMLNIAILISIFITSFLTRQLYYAQMENLFNKYDKK